MMAAIFGSYALLIWLVFAKLKLVRLTLPLAIVLAAVGPLFAFYVILSMNNFHPSSTDARVFQRVVQITPHITVPGRVQNVTAQANTPLKKGEVLFTIDPRPFQFEVNRLEAALAAAAQLVPQLKAALEKASAEVERTGAQMNLARGDFDRQKELFERGVVAQAALVVLALLAMAGMGLSPPLVYRWLKRQRRRQAVAQLPDALLGLSTNMRAGLSLSQALETVSAYAPAPLSQELTLMLRELRIGLPFSEAVDHLHDRIPEVEVQLVTAAMKVSREVGGNLAEALERIGDTLRKRLQMEGKIASLTAQGKLQGLVMTGLPIFLVLALMQLEPDAMRYLFHSFHGWMTILVVIALELVGYHFIHKIVNIDV